MDIKFPCSGCGCCCKRLNIVVANIEKLDDENKEILKFPYNYPNGICENLTEDNKCSVYENRPLICNFDKFSEFYAQDKPSFYNEIIKSCNKMMDEDNIDNSFKLNEI